MENLIEREWRAGEERVGGFPAVRQSPLGSDRLRRGTDKWGRHGTSRAQNR
jgi:hypothetical protein